MKSERLVPLKGKKNQRIRDLTDELGETIYRLMEIRNELYELGCRVEEYSPYESLLNARDKLVEKRE